MNFTTTVSILILSLFVQLQIGNKAFANQAKHSIISLNLYDSPPDFVSLLQIENYSLLKNAHVFPLAIDTHLDIDLAEYGNYEIYLFDKNGRKIFKRKIHNNIQTSFDLNNLESGHYLLYIIDRIHKQAANFNIEKK